ARDSYALVAAAREPHVECMSVLMDNGADMNCRNGSVLWGAVRSGKVDIVSMLLQIGAATHLGDRLGALAEAKRRGYSEVVKLIEEHVK
ncbi:hypothetical protein HDU93_004814, partial [Gonapodya sp. JEL0774]